MHSAGGAHSCTKHDSHPPFLKGDTQQIRQLAIHGSDRDRIEDVCNNLSIEKIEYRNENDVDVKKYINPIDTTWKWFTIP